MNSETITAASAGTWQLGDLTVNRIGFGAMRLTKNADGTPSDRDQAITVLRRAIELGVNHIDTAAFYFSPLRSANELINRALAPYPDDLVITTKVWPGRDPSGDWSAAATPQQLRGQVEENLRQLGRDYLDVVNLRNMNRVWTDSIADHFGALAELRDAGLIRHLGVSNVSAEHLAQAQAIAPVVCVQTAVRMCWPSPAPVIRITWWRTWPSARCGSPTTRWPALARSRKGTVPMVSRGTSASSRAAAQTFLFAGSQRGPEAYGRLIRHFIGRSVDDPTLSSRGHDAVFILSDAGAVSDHPCAHGNDWGTIAFEPADNADSRGRGQSVAAADLGSWAGQHDSDEGDCRRREIPRCARRRRAGARSARAHRRCT
jgi:hypothetical protein